VFTARYGLIPYIKQIRISLYGPRSSVRIATDYGLDGPGIETQWGRYFSPVQTGPGAHPASCTMEYCSTVFRCDSNYHQQYSYSDYMGEVKFYYSCLVIPCI